MGSSTSTSILEASILHHVTVVLLLLWFLNSFNWCHPVAYFVSLIYLYLVHERYVMRLEKKLQFEEKRQANQRRVLSDSETVRWLNHAIEKIWLVCMEEIVSKKILLPIIPWFLQKYKPWTVKEAVVQDLYLGRSPPIFTEMRVLRQSNDDDHLVLELGMNFRTADDMNATLAVKMTRRLGFGMWAKLNLLGLHVEGKVLIGVKFIRKWPFLGRLRVCFAEPPYFQMTVKPVFSHGLDVTEVPGIAGWLDKLLAVAFEETLVEPNMLVVDVEKFASPEQENWFSVDAKEPIAHAIVEVIDAAEMKPSDLNGLADPYVKGQVGPYRFRTKTQKKTLAPKWHEEFKIPITSWETPNMLTIEVRDKDRFVDDTLGDCSINLGDLRDGQRHDMWLSLQNIKMGRLHLAITIVEGNGKFADQTFEGENEDDEYKRTSFATDTAKKESFSSRSSDKSPKIADKYEPIDVEGQRETGIWVHHPGSEVSQVWEPRKGKNRRLDGQIRVEGSDSFKSMASSSCQNDGSSSTDESADGNKPHPKGRVRRGLQKIGSLFHRSPRNEKPTSGEEQVATEQFPSPHVNLKAINTRDSGVKFIVDDAISAPSSTSPRVDGRESLEGSGPESPDKVNVKDKAKNILKQAGKSARDLKLSFSRKVSRKFSGELGSPPVEGDIPEEYDASDADTLPSSVPTPQGELDSIVPSPSSVSGNSSFKLKEDGIQSSNNPSVSTTEPVEKVNLGDTETTTGSANVSAICGDTETTTGSTNVSAVGTTEPVVKENLVDSDTRGKTGEQY